MVFAKALSIIVALVSISGSYYYYSTCSQQSCTLHSTLTIHRQLEFLFPSLSTTTPTKTITAYANGESSNGYTITLQPDQVSSTKALATYLSQFVKVKLYKAPADQPIIADRVYTGEGKLVESFADIQPNSRLYLVAPGLLFVWPFVEFGHKVVLDVPSRASEEKLVVESFSEHPRVFHVHGFFSDQEADALVKHILEITDESHKLQQSHVGHRSGDKRVSAKRTSENAFDQSSPTAMKIRRRSFELLGIPGYQDDMCDGLQLLRYQKRQAYIPHTDYFGEDTSTSFNWAPYNNGSNRFATVFLYLSNVTRGGQTVFTKAEMPSQTPKEYQHPPQTPDEVASDNKLFEEGTWQHEMVQQCRTKLAAYPRKGHAILFYSQKGDGSLDPLSLHGGCPVLEGTKWAANLWVWNRRRFGLDPVEAGVKPKKNDMKVVFYNDYDQAGDLYYKTTFMRKLLPHENIRYDTFQGHEWNFQINGKVVGTHVMDAKQGQIQEVHFPSTGTSRDEL